MNASPDAMGLHERGVLIYVNRGMVELLRASGPDALVGHSILEFAHPSFHTALIERQRSHETAQGIAPPLEGLAVRVDGQAVDIELQSSRLVVEGRHVVLATLRDVTPRKSAEAALRRQAAIFAKAEQVASFGVWSQRLGADDVGNWSDGMYALLGVDRATWKYSNEALLEMMHPDDRSSYAAARQRMITHREPLVTDIRIPQPDGSVRWLRGRADAERDADGVPLITGMVVDVTERRVLEEQLLHAQKMDVAGRVAGSVAHDFNNLLLVMMGQLALAQRAPTADAVAGEHLSRLKATLEQAAALSRQLLSLSSKQPVQPQELDVAHALNESRDLLRRICGDNIGVHFAVEETPLYVFIDAGQWNQIVLNLVLNARDAIHDSGSLFLSLARTTLNGKPAVLLTARDTGHGMSRELQVRIFEPFFTTKLPGHGTGLGLSTLASAVAAAGGRVEVESAPDEGATFRVTLPASEGTAEAPAPAREKPAAARPKPHGRVLLVEDSKNARWVLSLSLRAEGFTVEEAESAEEAMHMLERGGTTFDVLVTDVLMPGMGGKELVRRSRAHRPDLKVVLMSGYAPGEGLNELLEHPGTRYLEKPFVTERLVTALHELLSE